MRLLLYSLSDTVESTIAVVVMATVVGYSQDPLFPETWTNGNKKSETRFLTRTWEPNPYSSMLHRICNLFYRGWRGCLLFLYFKYFLNFFYFICILLFTLLFILLYFIILFAKNCSCIT